MVELYVRRSTLLYKVSILGLGFGDYHAMVVVVERDTGFFSHLLCTSCVTSGRSFNLRGIGFLICKRSWLDEVISKPFSIPQVGQLIHLELVSYL